MGTYIFRIAVGIVRALQSNSAIESSIRLHSNLHVLCERNEERESNDIECV